MADQSNLAEKRRENWCQTSDTRIPDSDAAARFIDRVGLATLYPVSPEIPAHRTAWLGRAWANSIR